MIITFWPLPASLASAPERSGVSAAKIAERSARACVLAADLEGAAKEARRTAPRAPEERLEANALTADLADEPRRTDAREDATAPGDEGRGEG